MVIQIRICRNESWAPNSRENSFTGFCTLCSWVYLKLCQGQGRENALRLLVVTWAMAQSTTLTVQSGSLGCVEQIPAGYSRAITFRHTSTTLARLCMTWHLTRWWMRPTAFLALRAEREVGTAAETVSAYVPTRPMSSRVKSCGSDGTVSKGDHPRIPLLLSAFCLDPKLTRSIQQERTRTC